MILAMGKSYLITKGSKQFYYHEKISTYKNYEIGKYTKTFFDNIILGHFKIVYIYRLRKDTRLRYQITKIAKPLHIGIQYLDFDELCVMIRFYFYSCCWTYSPLKYFCINFFDDYKYSIINGL